MTEYLARARWNLAILSVSGLRPILKILLSKSEFESDHTLLSKNDIRPRIIYETIVLLPLMKLNFYQVLLWSYMSDIRCLIFVDISYPIASLVDG